MTLPTVAGLIREVDALAIGGAAEQPDSRRGEGEPVGQRVADAVDPEPREQAPVEQLEVAAGPAAPLCWPPAPSPIAKSDAVVCWLRTASSGVSADPGLEPSLRAQVRPPYQPSLTFWRYWARARRRWRWAAGGGLGSEGHALLHVEIHLLPREYE